MPFQWIDFALQHPDNDKVLIFRLRMQSRCRFFKEIVKTYIFGFAFLALLLLAAASLIGGIYGFWLLITKLP